MIFLQMAAAAGRAGEFVVDSAGIIGHHDGAAPDARMAAALRERNYRVFGTARKLRMSDLDGFDLIVAMDEINLTDIRGLDPLGVHHDKIQPFVSYCTRHSAPRVPDPYYGGQRGFDHVIDLLEDGCEGILNALATSRAELAGYQEMTSSDP